MAPELGIAMMRLSEGVLAWALGPTVPWRRYLWDATGNSLAQLGLVAVVLLGWFVLSLIRRRARVRQMRSSIPLVIGGGGTRGKSGTERCKAAMFQAYGARVCCKTTGSYAALLLASPNQEAVELPEYRPGGLASYWEQLRSLQAASELNSEVYLYECMAVNPRYMEVIQDGWMRDDFTTLTNTLPDHEDLQGPAGFNVAESLASFLPGKGIAWTAERQMFPILKAAAARKGTDLKQVPWSDAALVTRDVLNRMPYREHPRNIALVLALARHLGIDEDFALKEMAAHVVPDFGALLRFPSIQWGGRALDFSNVMAANGPSECMDSLVRLGFDRLRTHETPNEWLVMLLNNRADRPARTQAFAALAAARLPGNMFILTGDDPEGFRTQIEEQIDVHEAQWSLPKHADASELRFRVERDLEKVGLVCRQPGDLERMATYILKACGVMGAVVEITLRNVAWKKFSMAAHNVRGIRSEREDAVLEKAWAEVLPELHGILENLWKNLSKEKQGAQNWVEASECQAFLCKYWVQLRVSASLRKEVLGATHSEAGGGVGPGGLPEELNRIYIDFMKHQQRARMVIYDEQEESEEQMLQRLFREVPPGHTAHLIGLQNIQGVGRRMVRMWRKAKEVHDKISVLAGSDALANRDALNWLKERPRYEYCESLMATVELEKIMALHKESVLQVTIREIIERIEQDRLEDEQRGDESGRLRGANQIVKSVFGFVAEPVAAIQRRRRYRQIMDDLKHARVSRRRAAREIAQLTNV